MLLQVSNVSKSYGAQPILSNLTFHIQDRERIGLVGVNGAGKSTLLQIIAGELTADLGNIYIAKDVKIGYLKQNNTMPLSQTIWNEMLSVFSDVLQAEQEMRELERLMSESQAHSDTSSLASFMERYAKKTEWFKANGGYEIETKIRSILQGLGFSQADKERMIHTLSGGQKSRLALAKMLLQEPHLLLLDEPTNHLDIPTLNWLETYLRNYSGAIIVVSHDRYFLDALATSIYEIERHKSKKYTGNYSTFIETKAQEAMVQLKHYEKQQNEIEKMEDFVQRNLARASTTKRAQSRRKAIDRLDRIDKPLGQLQRASFSFEMERPSAKDVLIVDNLSLAYDPAKPLAQGVSLRMYRGDSIALIGANGVGKSTLIKTIIGQLQAQQGHIQWGVHTTIGYYDQEQANLDLSKTIMNEVWGAFPHVEELHIRKVLAGFLFRGEDVLKKISSLSGGERARVALAKLMLQQANVLVLDEPTNHLDLYSKEILESALLDYQGSLLFISHDRYFLNKIAEKMVEMTPEHLVTYIGNYDDYLDKKAEIAELEAIRIAENKLPTKVNQLPDPPHHIQKNAKRDDRTRKRKIEQVEIEIAQYENEIAHLEAQLTDPDVYQDYVRVQDITTSLQTAKSKWNECYEQWSAWADEEPS
jgi:ATP-binding cassette subfamily F protein 3